MFTQDDLLFELDSNFRIAIVKPVIKAIAALMVATFPDKWKVGNDDWDELVTMINTRLSRIRKRIRSS